MVIQICSDLQSEQTTPLLYRLVEYSKVLKDYDAEWSHLKHNGDFHLVNNLPTEAKDAFDYIYSDGRGWSFLSDNLIAFNSAEQFHSLKSFVDSFG